MQNSTKLTFGLTILAALTIGSLAIECYICEGELGEEGGCGQDPFRGHGVTTPNVTTTSGFTSCIVSIYSSVSFNNITEVFFQIAIENGAIGRQGYGDDKEACEAALEKIIEVTNSSGTFSCCDTNLCNSAVESKAFFISVTIVLFAAIIGLA